MGFFFLTCFQHIVTFYGYDCFSVFNGCSSVSFTIARAPSVLRCEGWNLKCITVRSKEKPLVAFFTLQQLGSRLLSGFIRISNESGPKFLTEPPRQEIGSRQVFSDEKGSLFVARERPASRPAQLLYPHGTFIKKYSTALCKQRVLPPFSSHPSGTPLPPECPSLSDLQMETPQGSQGERRKIKKVQRGV